MPLLFMEADIDEVGPIIRLTSSNVLLFIETPFFGEGGEKIHPTERRNAQSPFVNVSRDTDCELETLRYWVCHERTKTKTKTKNNPIPYLSPSTTSTAKQRQTKIQSKKKKKTHKKKLQFSKIHYIWKDYDKRKLRNLRNSSEKKKKVRKKKI